MLRWTLTKFRQQPFSKKSQESSSFLLGTARFDCCHAVDQGSNSNLVHHFEINMFLTMLNSWILKKGKLEVLEGPLVAPPVPNPPSLPRSQSHPQRIGFLRGMGEGPITSITPTCGNKTSKIQGCWKKKSPQNKVAKKKSNSNFQDRKLCVFIGVVSLLRATFGPFGLTQPTFYE